MLSSSEPDETCTRDRSKISPKLKGFFFQQDKNDTNDEFIVSVFISEFEISMKAGKSKASWIGMFFIDFELQIL